MMDDANTFGLDEECEDGPDMEMVMADGPTNVDLEPPLLHYPIFRDPEGVSAIPTVMCESLGPLDEEGVKDELDMDNTSDSSTDSSSSLSAALHEQENINNLEVSIEDIDLNDNSYHTEDEEENYARIHEQINLCNSASKKRPRSKDKEPETSDEAQDMGLMTLRLKIRNLAYSDDVVHTVKIHVSPQVTYGELVSIVREMDSVPRKKNIFITHDDKSRARKLKDADDDAKIADCHIGTGDYVRVIYNHRFLVPLKNLEQVSALLKARRDAENAENGAEGEEEENNSENNFDETLSEPDSSEGEEKGATGGAEATTED